MVFALSPLQRSSTNAISCPPPSCFGGILRNLVGDNQLWSHYFTANIILLLWTHIRRTFLKNPQEKFCLDTKGFCIWTETEKKWSYGVCFFFAAGFALLPLIGDVEYLITASQGHEFLFEFLSGLQWLILAQEQTSGMSLALDFCFVQSWLLLLTSRKVFRYKKEKLWTCEWVDGNGGQYTYWFIFPEAL